MLFTRASRTCHPIDISINQSENLQQQNVYYFIYETNLMIQETIDHGDEESLKRHQKVRGIWPESKFQRGSMQRRLRHIDNVGDAQ